MRAKPHDLLSAIESFWDELVVGPECMFSVVFGSRPCVNEKTEFVSFGGRRRSSILNRSRAKPVVAARTGHVS